ncbi:HD superfamily hydrolase [Tupanvirus deep ocean]|uniref:HD superfamily hydrolase n=2 Tax=Tupanvirus TaxID=2094720 RepID=A0AC62A9Y6_9VIRU|nr:HD superfamily hydrolase [Tupanvirus deep ocean]QKU34596.1 HD superfamily hydrolase [Tupanvirus deep ocean]
MKKNIHSITEEVFEGVINYFSRSVKFENKYLKSGNYLSIGSKYFSEIYDVLNLCTTLTIEYDESHDVMHHFNVFRNSVDILISLQNNEEINLDEYDYNYVLHLITYASLLHDTVDHKYKKNYEEKKLQLYVFLNTNAPTISKDVIWIIENISYSKEVKNGYPLHENRLVQLARDIVSDADKLEALGTQGINRCRQYTISINPKLPEESITKLVIEHCHEKLLKLTDNFIRTKAGKEMALPLHQEIVQYVNINSNF